MRSNQSLFCPSIKLSGHRLIFALFGTFCVEAFGSTLSLAVALYRNDEFVHKNKLPQILTGKDRNSRQLIRSSGILFCHSPSSLWYVGRPIKFIVGWYWLHNMMLKKIFSPLDELNSNLDHSIFWTYLTSTSSSRSMILPFRFAFVLESRHLKN